MRDDVVVREEILRPSGHRRGDTAKTKNMPKNIQSMSISSGLLCNEDTRSAFEQLAATGGEEEGGHMTPTLIKIAPASRTSPRRRVHVLVAA
jgi:hypothetical protein